MATYPGVPYFTAEQVFALISMRDAVFALERALVGGLEPSAALSRSSIPLKHGSFLLMPSEYGEYASVKIASVAPENSAQGLPKIQGTFLLFDARTLSPVAIMDGAALTSIRTPAVSALGVRHLARPDASRVLVYGTGPQAFNHVLATAAVREVSSVEVIGRSLQKTRRIVGELTSEGFTASVGSSASVAEADIVLCCTSAREPLFDGMLVRDDAVVVAMGSHEPEARETDDALLRRATVYVEDVETALREAGDVVIGIANGALRREDLGELAPLVREGAKPRRGPAFFKTVGMGWEDLVTAQLVFGVGRD